MGGTEAPEEPVRRVPVPSATEREKLVIGSAIASEPSPPGAGRPARSAPRSRRTANEVEQSAGAPEAAATALEKAAGNLLESDDLLFP